MEPDRPYDGGQRLDRPAVRAAGSGLTLDEIRAAVAERLTPSRLEHVRSVADTVGRLAAGWDRERREAAGRAAWLHDGWKCEPVESIVDFLRAGGEEPDLWALRHAPGLLHAQAAAVWAAREGESDPEVLLAVRHHPTGHADWGPVGWALYVADFCEPSRSFAASLGTDRLLERAVAAPDSLPAVARDVLALRLVRMIRASRPIHPDGWRAWNAWSAGEEGP